MGSFTAASVRYLTNLCLAASVLSCATTMGPKTHSIRLRPGQDVRSELEKLTSQKNLKAGAIVSAVGSLKQLSLRMANQKETTTKTGFFEVVSLSGTLAPDGPHLHMSAADSKGQVLGGHLTEGNIVYTTLEIVILEPEKVTYRREIDPQTTYKELTID